MPLPEKFWAVCMQNGPSTEQIQVRKFTFNAEKNKKDGPWFDVPKHLWPLKSHPLIAKAINTDKLKEGGYRTVSIRLTTKGGVPTEAASKYLDKNLKFSIGGILLTQEESIQSEPVVNSELDKNSDLTVFQIFSAFGEY